METDFKQRSFIVNNSFNEENTQIVQVDATNLDVQDENQSDGIWLNLKKNRKAIYIILIAVLVVCLVFAYYMLNKDVFTVEKSIDNLGEITLESKESIKDAEKLLEELSESEKKRVSNKDVLEHAKEKYIDLYVESYEKSDEYTSIKKNVTSMQEYNPIVTFNKNKKLVTISFTVDRDLEQITLTYPTLVKSSWNQLVETFNGFGETLSLLANASDDYGIGVVIEIRSQIFQNSKLYESLNGETQFNILD